MSTLQQRRASHAFDRVSSVPQASHAKYATAAHRMPALIRNGGLCQALYFAESRNEDGYRLWLDHAASFAHERRRIPSGSSGSLLRQAREAEVASYVALTSEVLAYGDWLQRMVRAVLKAGASDDE